TPPADTPAAEVPVESAPEVQVDASPAVPVVLGVTLEREAAAISQLPRTGEATSALVLLAGAILFLGGLLTMGSEALRSRQATGRRATA
ncbi:MAG TPA: LPXTG cell wall anchor domain-containing protein, partial [Acidimicrobiales bacterium]|nr:LPXTG cell wall anchor domain-containing protein [Acidimicrobiales bacterium]